MQEKSVTGVRSEEHTSELQSHSHLVCRLLLEKKTLHNTHSPRCSARGGTAAGDAGPCPRPPRDHCCVRLPVVLVYSLLSFTLCFFFFKDTAPPEFSPLPLPDALPI